jgi:hypothetical protein
MREDNPFNAAFNGLPHAIEVSKISRPRVDNP